MSMLIQIKRGPGIPEHLEDGEMALDLNTDIVYIGKDNNVVPFAMFKDIENTQEKINEVQRIMYNKLSKKADAENLAGGFNGGSLSSAFWGGSVGCNAETDCGFSGGDSSKSGYGVSAGYCACAGKDSSGAYIDTIQLGTGTNTNPGTLQVYDYQITDSNGNIIPDRIKENTYLKQEIINLFAQKNIVNMDSSGIINLTDSIDKQDCNLIIYGSEEGTGDLYIDNDNNPILDINGELQYIIHIKYGSEIYDIIIPQPLYKKTIYNADGTSFDLVDILDFKKGIATYCFEQIIIPSEKIKSGKTDFGKNYTGGYTKYIPKDSVICNIKDMMSYYEVNSNTSDNFHWYIYSKRWSHLSYDRLEATFKIPNTGEGYPEEYKDMDLICYVPYGVSDGTDNVWSLAKKEPINIIKSSDFYIKKDNSIISIDCKNKPSEAYITYGVQKDIII